MTAPSKVEARLLLVDDDPDLVWALGRYLVREGFAVTTCGDGEEALKLLQDQTFDIIVTDIQMPNLNGISLLEWIRKNRPRARVIVITAYVSDAVRRVAARKGAYLFLAKPVDPRLLVEVLREPAVDGKFSGSIEGLDLMDCLQIVLMSREPHLLEVHDGTGCICRIWARGRKVVHCQTERSSGLQAFLEVARLESGQFVMLPWIEPPQHSIDMETNHLLLEVARLLDESQIGAKAPRGLSSVLSGNNNTSR